MDSFFGDNYIYKPGLFSYDYCQWKYTALCMGPRVFFQLYSAIWNTAITFLANWLLFAPMESIIRKVGIYRIKRFNIGN